MRTRTLVQIIAVLSKELDQTENIQKLLEYELDLEVTIKSLSALKKIARDKSHELKLQKFDSIFKEAIDEKK